VTVEAPDDVCRSDQPQIMRVACGREHSTVRVQPPYEKVFPESDYDVAWDYYSIGGSSPGTQPSKLQVAFCSPIEPNPARPKGTAICTSVWAVDGVVVSLGFEETELAKLPMMRAKATQMLRSWKVG
jgi:hypothetical protein